ncbi:expressed unknown protein [Seminavis robusta]|uniref:Uncharacterized protein n=1 Tax=Seminavis robusta TaxID=568900 RepID=A0A9N8DVC5_9STRA|nr:expressed unknown protein [Seminavis robusta]|eukprot:Sro389_g132580.1 n/a (889) ;mRNA; f:28629-31295
MVFGFLTDSRTEWAVRWTVMHAICYVLFFYPPTTNFYLDWSLPVQLISGGNLAFYNAGFHAWFGLGAAFAMTVAGAILSLIFPLLQNDELPSAFVVLMIIVIVLVAPFFVAGHGYIGVLNNLRSIGILLVIIFLEVFYGPILNLRSVEGFNIKAIWTEVVGPNAIPALAYVAISWAVYAIPPWHSGTYQMLHLSSDVMGGVAGCLKGAADLVRGSQPEKEPNEEAKDDDNDAPAEEPPTQPPSAKETFRSMATTLMQQTSFAGLYVPISLYGDMGVYESSLFFPHLSLRADSFQKLGRQLDRTVYHVALVLWALGEAVEHLDKEDDTEQGSIEANQLLRKATAAQLDAAAGLANSISLVLQCPRKTYQRTPIETKPATASLRESTLGTSTAGIRSSTAGEGTNATSGGGSVRENIVTNPLLFDAVDSAGAKRAATTAKAKQIAYQAGIKSDQVAEKLVDVTNSSDNQFMAMILYAITADLTSGQREFVHFDGDDYLPIDPNNNRGSLGRLQYVTETLQNSWTDNTAWPRMVYRLLFLEQIEDLVLTWFQGMGQILTGSCFAPGNTVQRRRTLGRGLQYLVGTVGLYAMATWWPAYSTLLGSSSTGQWTMVSFYVCFRATADETIHAGVLRSIGHAIGAMLSWGINTGVTTSGGRIGCHLAVTLVFTWLIPPPFTVVPSSFQFGPLDILTVNLFEGLLTTYHLTSVLVLSTDIESATKARALSQCLGAAAAVFVTVVILPWWAKPEAEFTRSKFRKHCKNSLQNLTKSDRGAVLEASAAVENLLQARRDVSSAQEASSWLFCFPSADGGLGESLTRDAFGAVALEAIVQRVQNEGKNMPEDIIAALKASKLGAALTAIRHAIGESKESRQDLAILYMEVLLLGESMIAN